MGTVPKYQCRGKCALTAKPDPVTLNKLETGFKSLFESESEPYSLLKKYLSRKIFDDLKFKKTKFGASLLDCIQSGLENHDSNVGIYAPDADAYTAFADIFDPIIEDYHCGFSKSDKHPKKDFGDSSTLVNVDPSGKFVLSVRVRCGRNIEGYPFNTSLTKDQYKDLEKKIGITLAGLKDDIKGTYHPLSGMDLTVQQKLTEDNYLFREGNKFLESANGYRFWPEGRGIFYNEDKSFLVWVNEEDQVRIISMQPGGDLKAVYERLVTGINEIEQKLNFVHDERLGFLASCPTNIGTTIRASVHIKLPKLTKKKEKLEELAAKHMLQLRGTTGEYSEVVGGVYDISNKRRLGLTEYTAVKTMQDGILEIIQLEKSMKQRKNRKPTGRQVARKAIFRNPALERLKWPKFLPSYLYKF